LGTRGNAGDRTEQREERFMTDDDLFKALELRSGSHVALDKFGSN
jgi:hypothetical protein